MALSTDLYLDALNGVSPLFLDYMCLKCQKSGRKLVMLCGKAKNADENHKQTVYGTSTMRNI